MRLALVVNATRFASEAPICAASWLYSTEKSTTAALAGMYDGGHSRSGQFVPGHTGATCLKDAASLEKWLSARCADARSGRAPRCVAVQRRAAARRAFLYEGLLAPTLRTLKLVSVAALRPRRRRQSPRLMLLNDTVPLSAASRSPRPRCSPRSARPRC